MATPPPPSKTAVSRAVYNSTHDQQNLSPRPELVDRTDSCLPPHERPAITNVPVTPGIHLGTYDSRPSSQHTNYDDPAGVDSPSYFRPRPEQEKGTVASPEPIPGRATSPTEAAKGARSGSDILKRMSRDYMRGRRESLTEIRSTNPDLALSGNIISATFTIPYSLQYRKGADWDLRPRRGQSTLFDSFSYLSSDETPWSHTVVAWTGEIDPPPDVPSPPTTPPATTTHMRGLNALSAPVPIGDGASGPPPQKADGLWIPYEDQLRLENQLSHGRHIKTVPVWLSDDTAGSEEGILLQDQARWRRFAEQELYTLFHYIQHEATDGRKERVQWADFYRMNQKFANKIIDTYKPGDIVIIHDFYLMLLPMLLRPRAPKMYIAFFLHAPFPSSEYLRCLPRRKEVLEGVLGSNLIGFQSFSYARHFTSCCTRVLGFPSDFKGIDVYGARVEIDVFPIGIDASKVEKLAWSDSVNENFAALKKMYEGKKIIVGRDRLDSIRGVDKKLVAFERFLEQYPEWRQKVVLIQVTSPTSVAEDNHGANSKLASRVNELVTSINGAHGSLGFSPIQHYPQYISQDEYFALLRAGDVGLITSVRDGMNTTSLEYVICQRDNHGPLIISEFSGTAGSLKDAFQINPWDYNKVAEEINNALTLPADERQRMQEQSYAHVTTRTVQYWITSFLRRLVHVLGNRKNVLATPLLDRADLLLRYRAAGKRLFMFDYDGTLTPIVRDPAAAVPGETVIRTLKTLSKDPKNAVWIISGRDQEFLTHHLGHIKELGFSAEHGSFMRRPGEETWENLAEKFDMGWQVEVMDVFEKFTDAVPGSFIERKRCALTWHYRQADPHHGPLMARECQKQLEATVSRKWDVDVMAGKANIEVRPTFINKGEIVRRLVASYDSRAGTPSNSSTRLTPDDRDILKKPLTRPRDQEANKVGNQDKLNQDAKDAIAAKHIEFALCLGDDFTDEDMFRALNSLATPGDPSAALKEEKVFTVTVGPSTKVTLAKWHLLEPEDVVECVGLLAGDAEAGFGGDGAVERGAGDEVVMGQVNLGVMSVVSGHVPED